VVLGILDSVPPRAGAEQIGIGAAGILGVMAESTDIGALEHIERVKKSRYW
jgi:predicted nucleic acid-binding protein